MGDYLNPTYHMEDPTPELGAYYDCGGRADIARGDPLPEICPKNDCDAELTHVVDWVTGNTISSTEIPSEALGVK